MVSWRPLREGTFENSLGELFLEGRVATPSTPVCSSQEGEDAERLVADRPFELAR